jgi:CRISPR/Cas system-associated endoribonuclease Cas2
VAKELRLALRSNRMRRYTLRGELMNRFLVTYDLVGTDEASDDYERLIKKIKTYPNWGRVQKSVWLIRTSDSAAQVRDALGNLIDANDRLLVIEVTGTAAWRKEICDREWLRKFLTSS